MAAQEFYATCGTGLEGLLADELRSLGLTRVRPLTGGVAFFGSLKDGYRACLWSRIASRVQLVLTRIGAKDANALYEGVRTIEWSDHLAPGATLAVTARGRNDQLVDTRFTALRVKDAIVDTLRDLRGERPDVDTRTPDVLVDVTLRGEKATVAIDLSGEALHRRGYRVPGEQTTAPLKENLASGLLAAGRWFAISRADDAVLVDPLCGSGTIAIEAALSALDRAPGLLRSRWGFTGWAGHDADAWDDLLAEADDRAEVGAERGIHIFASDSDPKAIDLARRGAARAGVASYISFAVCDVAELDPAPWADREHVLFALNPPYGERMASGAELPALYTALSRLVNAEGSIDAPLAIITPDERIALFIGRVQQSELEVRNGPIVSAFRVFSPRSENDASGAVANVTLKDGREVPVLIERSDQFAARLTKVARERRKWAKRDGASSYRIYDQDLPDYAVSIDIHAGAGPDEGSTFVQIAEYAPPKEIDPGVARARLADAVSLTSVILDVDPRNIFVKERRRSKGGTQYGADLSGEKRVAIVEEDGILFELDMASRLDTGLFLDHRPMRRRLRAEASGKRVLNLFCYTATATCHAIEGGAIETVSVDLSGPYLEVAERNFKLNGYRTETNQLIKADVLEWISDARHSSERFDVVFCDVPTFSNSKDMRARSFEVQRDHVELLIDVSRVLTREGVAYFSTNRRDFTLDTEALAKAKVVVEDISASTIPEDFARTPRIHKAYSLRRE